MSKLLDPVMEQAGNELASAKTPHTRLLDLMAGWSAYAQRDEGEGYADNPGVIDRICDLYQEAATLDVGPDERADERTQQALRAFLTDRVLPLVLGSVTER